MKKRTLKKLNSITKIKKGQNIITGKTWLPVFSGYYNTIFDGTESFIEYETNLSENEYKEYYKELYNSGVSYDFFKENLYEFCDFDECFNDASEYITSALLGVDHAGIIINTEYEKTISPKYYNFSNDSINCKITYNAKKLKKYINENFKKFSKHINSEYTSRDGFSSWHSNDVNDWIDFKNLGEHKLGSVLNFVLLNIDSEAELNLYYESNIHEAFINNVKIDFSGMIEKFSKKVA